MSGSHIKRASLRSFDLPDLYILQQVSLVAYMFFNIALRTHLHAIPDDQSWENFKDQFTEKFIPAHTLPRSGSSLCFTPLSLNLGWFHQLFWWVGINFDQNNNPWNLSLVFQGLFYSVQGSCLFLYHRVSKVVSFWIFVYGKPKWSLRGHAQQHFEVIDNPY